ncbi:TadE/TadG family type IV pilus assembly protein [Erythrobacter sp.]|uniref:TadE/TadG family type IV pilus assembly protein n=1 Tax=Erythrobacter sp. TaxID=1042 RepID=UPI00311E777B
MTGRTILRRFIADQSGGVAEFALLLPLIMLFMLGLIDAGRYAYDFNRGEKATQVGARVAVVTNPLVTQLTTYTFSGVTVGGVQLGQGDRIPQAALGTITCTSTACTCTVTPCLGGTLTLDTAAFAVMANRVKQIWPMVEDADITVEYSGSGLGYAGNPSGMDIAPFVTVRLTNMDFTSIFLFGGTVGFPDFQYTLTMEDGAGTQYN